MTENLTTQPDTSECAFDVRKWLGEAKRHSRSVPVYLDTRPIADAQKLQERITAHNRAAGDMDPGEALQRASELREEQAEVEAKIRQVKAVVTVTALSDADSEEIAAEYAKTAKDSTRQWDQTITGTCLALERLATINGERLTADQWRQLSEGSLAGGQWQSIKRTLLLASQELPDRLARRQQVPVTASTGTDEAPAESGA